MDAGTLNNAIVDAGCPTISTAVGKSDDRATWSFVPAANATQPQIDAGNNVIATIPINPKTSPSSADFIGRFTNAEYRAATATTWRQTAGNAKNWDVVVFAPVVNLKR